MHILSSSGPLQAEEDELRKKIRRGATKMQRDRAALAAAEAKLAAYRAAVVRIREATGYDDLQDVVDLFDRYEEEKFAKVRGGGGAAGSASPVVCVCGFVRGRAWNGLMKSTR